MAILGPVTITNTNIADVMLMQALLTSRTARQSTPQKCHQQKKSETRLILIFDRQVRHCRTDRGAAETQDFAGADGCALRNVNNPRNIAFGHVNRSSSEKNGATE